MNGSGFSDGKFEMSEEKIFTPLENDESKEIWNLVYEKLNSLAGSCHIVTNIGFQTHRTINQISNCCGIPVLTETDVGLHYFAVPARAQIGSSVVHMSSTTCARLMPSISVASE